MESRVSSKSHHSSGGQNEGNNEPRVEPKPMS